MELEERIDYTFERDLLIAKDYYPSNIVPIIIDRDNKLELKKAKWGFSTFDNKLIINARSETLLEKPFFKKEVITHRFLNRWIPKSVELVFVPMLTFLIMGTTEILAPMASRNSKVALSPCNESRFKSVNTTSFPIAPATR